MSAVRKLKTSAAPRALTVRRTERRPLPAVRHLTLPYHETARADLVPGETINALVQRTGWAERVGRKWSFRLPTICVLNGAPVLQRAWRSIRLRADDAIEFWSRPMGGNRSGTGKSVLGIVAVIALAAFAPWAGGVLAGALSLGSTAATIFAGAITIGGGLLISALTRPKAGGQSNRDDGQVDQLYSVAASGNTARLLQPIAVQYGRVKSFPDFAITPWSEFEDSDQYLNVLLSVGLGLYDYEKVYITDAVLWDSVNGLSNNFNDAEIAFYPPGAQVTLFPVNVVQSVAVAGQEITTDWLGGFPANPPGTLAKKIAVDLVFPLGLFALNDKSKVIQASARVQVDIRTIDDAGAPIGSWTNVFDQTFERATRNPLRKTVKLPVAPARYEVRVQRIGAAISDGSGANTVVWAGLRGFIDGPSSFPVSTVAIRIKATEQLTQASATKFAVLCTRKLPVWNGSIFVTQATRSPAWAFYDAAIDTTYGAGRPPSKVDFQGVFDLANAAAARSDRFDYRFTAGTPAPEAFDTILKGSRCRHRWSGDVLTIVRDEWSDTPRMLLTDREIARGSMSVKYALNTDDSADAVIVEYLDEDTWGPAEVQYPKNSISFTAVAPARIQLDGVVNREHAHREAGFYYLQSQLRRVQVTLDTEHDGRMLGFGSRVRVQSELPQTWGYTGAIVARSSNTLTLDSAPTWGVGSHYIAIRNKTGRQFGPVLCTQGVDAAHAILDAGDLAAVEAAQGTTLTAALTRRDGAEDPSFDFGVGEARARPCIVVSGRPNGERVTLALVVDSQAVHDTDLGDVPVLPSIPALRDPVAPVIANLYASFRQGIAEPILDVSWTPAAGAIYYLADVSYDGGLSWMRVYEGQRAGFSAVVDYAALRLRVQGIGLRHGAFFAVDVEPPTIKLANGVVDFAALGRQLQYQLDLLVGNQVGTLNHTISELETRLEELAAAAAAEGEIQEEARQEIAVLYAAQDTNIRAQVAIVAEAVTTETDARATSETLLEARVNQNIGIAIDTFEAEANATFATVSRVTAIEAKSIQGTASGLIEFKATSAPAGVSARFAILLTANVGGPLATTGIYLDLVPNGVGGHFGKLFFDVDQFTVGKAGAAIPPFFIVNNQVFINGAFINEMTGNKITVGTLSADRIDVNGIDINKLAAGSSTLNKLKQDHNNAHNLNVGGGSGNADITIMEITVPSRGYLGKMFVKYRYTEHNTGGSGGVGITAHVELQIFQNNSWQTVDGNVTADGLSLVQSSAGNKQYRLRAFITWTNGNGQAQARYRNIIMYYEENQNPKEAV